MIFPFFKFSIFWKYFVIFGVFVKPIAIFNIRIGFCVFNSILEHGLKIFFDPKIRNKRPPEIEKFPRSATIPKTKILTAQNKYLHGSHVERFRRMLRDF